MLDNEFTCPNGHTFRANAKIRARCTECGATARRDFKVAIAKVTEPKTEPKVDEPKVEPKPPSVLKPVLLKQGRPRVMATKTPVATKSTGNAKPKRPGVKRTPSNLIGKPKVSSGLVKSTRIKSRGTMPTITGKPIKTAPARGIKSAGNPRGARKFWEDVADKYGIGR